jgi:hypothetical protein
MTTWILPDGTTTTDSYEYSEAWASLANEVASLFPGYKVYAFNPGIHLTPPADFTNWNGCIHLTVEQAQLLVAEVRRRIEDKKSPRSKPGA